MLSIWGRRRAAQDGPPIWTSYSDGPVPDWDYAGIRPEAFREAILRRGAVMLRKAADKETLLEIKAALDALFNDYAATPAGEFERHLESNDPGERDLWEQIKRSHIFDRTFKLATGRSYYEIIRKSGLWALAEQAFPESAVAESQVCNCRRVSDADIRPLFDRPIEFHIDAQVFYDHCLSVNFWTPLDPCGVDAPGLEVIPLGVDETRKYLEHKQMGYSRRPADIGLMHHFRCAKLEAAPLAESGLVSRVWVPEFEVGDVLAFTNFTMHATHHTAAMSQPRVSVEVRVDLPGYRLRFPPSGGA